MTEGVGQRRHRIGDGRRVARRHDHRAIVGEVHRQAVAAVVEEEAHGLLWPAPSRQRHVEEFDDVRDVDGVTGLGQR